MKKICIKLIAAFLATGIPVLLVNYCVDASSAIRPQYTEMAQLALEGNIVATNINYNMRAYEMSIADQMEKIPDTIVIGSSRGMYLGVEITGYDDIYNSCVSGACVEDYYALLGLFYEKFEVLPNRVIMEISPWVYYEGNEESRWTEIEEYSETAGEMYSVINNATLESTSEQENPYISIPYFRYNLNQLIRNGFEVFKLNEAKISTDSDESADYPDGTIRYEGGQENESEERLQYVQQFTGACTYQNSQLMDEIDPDKAAVLENLVDYLLDNNVEVILYLQPFSETQCIYSLDQNLNPGFKITEEYLHSFADSRGIEMRGSCDCRKYGLTDIRFIDNMHLDKIGTNIVWNWEE